jgi:polyisoprenoid-binding protein YceI
VHSTIIFKCKHLDTSWQFGRFDDVEGTLTMDAAKPEASKVDVTISIESIDTNNEKRDADLKGPNFFDAKQFPTATFKSKSVAKKGEHVYSVTGDLMLHGTTKSVTIDMENTGSSDKMGPRAGFFGALKIKRSDYGIKAMADVLGDEVELTLTCEATAGKGK